MMLLQSTNHVPEVNSLVKVDPNDPKFLNCRFPIEQYPYYFVITLSGIDYYYCSNFPFYALEQADGSLIMVLESQGHTLRYGYSSRPAIISTGPNAKTVIGTKHGELYFKEYQRTPEQVATIVSNKPIVQW